MIWNLPQTKIESPEDSNLSILRRILDSRKITSDEDIERFLRPSLEHLYDPTNLKDADKAVDLILNTLKENKRIFIYGDYDVDGICSTSIVFDFLYRFLGADVVPYIPSRFEEGYGLGKLGLDRIVEQNGSLVVTVDCGIRDQELIQEYTKKGLSFIITDHHEPPKDANDNYSPPSAAKAVVHPMISDKYPFDSICGATVAWKLTSVLSEKAMELGLLAKQVDMNRYLDLVAMATVCDVMPLVEENRVIVKYGLEYGRNTINKGLEELMKESSVAKEELEAYHFGFVLGPRLNAAGRISKAIEGVRLLTSQQQGVTKKVAKNLENLNLKRQAITKKLITEAENQLGDQLDNNMLVVHGEEWEEGIIGLVAGRICEKYHKPVLAISVGKDEATGSARSIKGYNVTDALASTESLLLKYGGHAQAAGFSLESSKLDEFKQKIVAHANENIDDQMLERGIDIVTQIRIDEIDFELYEELMVLKPFGYGNPTPIFAVFGVRVEQIRQLGKDKSHLKLVVSSQGSTIDCIGFSIADKYSWVKAGDTVDIAASIGKNSYMGRDSLQLQIKDIRKSE